MPHDRSVTELCEHCGVDLSSVAGECRRYFLSELCNFVMSASENVTCKSCGHTMLRRLRVPFGNLKEQMDGIVREYGEPK